MQITIEIPAALRQYCAGSRELKIDDSPSLAAMIGRLTSLHPKLARRLVSPEGEFYDFVGVFLNRKSLAGQTADRIVLKNGDVLSLIPAMAGG